MESALALSHKLCGSMEESARMLLVQLFRDIPDPRMVGKSSHKLHDLLGITVCAVICGLDHWTPIEDFGKTNEAWFRTFLELPNGIPSHDTFGKVLAALDPDAFERRIQQWIHARFDSATRGTMDQGDYYETVEKSHGRIETRKGWTCWQVDWLTQRHGWPGLASRAAVECTRTIHDKTSAERRYFISSHSGREAQKRAALIRNPWRVENQLHWTLDVCFNEDQCRVRIVNAAQNLSRIRRISLCYRSRKRPARWASKVTEDVSPWSS